MSDPRLSLESIQQAISGDQEAVEVIVEQSSARVLVLATRLSGRRVDPRDVAHDVLILMATKIHTLENPRKFEAWTYGITRKVAAQYARRAWFQRWVGSPHESDLVDESGGPAKILAQRESDARYEEMIRKLPMRQREVIVLICVEERTAPEVAELLGIPLGTVRSRLRAGKERLSRVLQQWGGISDHGLPPGEPC